MENKKDALDYMSPEEMEAYKCNIERISLKHSSTKSGCSQHIIAKRRKRNKNKKTHR